MFRPASWQIRPMTLHQLPLGDICGSSIVRPTRAAIDLGTGIFEVHPDVKHYIAERLKALGLQSPTM
jgi:hypothetical protein